VYVLNHQIRMVEVEELSVMDTSENDEETSEVIGMEALNKTKQVLQNGNNNLICGENKTSKI